ncbi:MAG: DNA primase [Acidimicrobiales bacterium]
MGIVTEDEERVRSATDLVALVSERVALRRVGTQWVGLCPFHGENTASFSVNGELGVYYCFGCQVRGDAISFLRETEHLDFATAVETLAARAGITLRYDGEDHAGGAHKRATELTEAMERAVNWYHARLLGAPDAADARRYLRSRGYDSETVKKYRLGWAPAGWDALVGNAGVKGDLLVAVGLAYRNKADRLTDSFRARVLFPIFDAAGRPVGLGGRLLPGGSGPKYKNTQATPIYDKSRVLYGLNWAKSTVVQEGRVVVCEGYTDVIGLHRAGVTEAVATCGTALAEGHIKLLTGFSRRIVLAYDADPAGQGAAEHFYDWERRFDAEISVVSLPAGADPADLAQSDPERLRQAVLGATPYLGFRLERLFAHADLRNPEGRARAAEASLALIAEHPDALVRDQYLMQVSDRCRLSPDQLRALPRPVPATAGRPAAASPGTPVPSAPRARPGPAPGPLPARPPGRSPLPRPEMEALRLAVHRPDQVAGRLHPVLFRSELARATFAELAGAMTLHAAIESAAPEVADLLSQLAVVDSKEDADDVVRRLVEQAAARALAELRREARSSSPTSSHAELAKRTALFQLGLQALRSVEPGPDYETRLETAERQLSDLLFGSPSMTTSGPSSD